MLAFLVRFLSLFALALWVGGGAAVAFLVTPAVFEHAGSRKRAGEIVGAILQRFDLCVLVAGSAAAAGAALELLGVVPAGDTPRGRLGLLLGMLSLALYSRLAITPKLARLRARMGDTLDRLPAEDPDRRAFGRLHGVSVVLLLVQLVLGAFALALSAPGAGPGGAGSTPPALTPVDPLPHSTPTL